MPKIHSTDFRNKVMEHYKISLHKSDTCKRFGVSRTTLNDWIRLEENTGFLDQPKIISGRPFLIKDLKSFKMFYESTTFKKLKDLIPLFEQKFGYRISYSSLLYTIRKLKLSKKKDF